MKSKDQILLENIYDRLGPNDYNSFVSDEGDKLNVIIKNFLKEYIAQALKNDAVLTYFKNNKGLTVDSDNDHKYMAIQDLLVDLQKNSNVKTGTSDIVSMAREIVKNKEEEVQYQ
jgi:hypothetical protein